MPSVNPSPLMHGRYDAMMLQLSVNAIVGVIGARWDRTRHLALALAMLAAAATNALAAGTISGRVTSSTTGNGLPNTVVTFYNLTEDNGDLSVTVTTDA